MSGYRDAMGNRPRDSTELDAAAAERLLASDAATGQIEHPQLAALLAAVAASSPPGSVPGEEAALAAFRAEVGLRSSATHPAESAGNKIRARLFAVILAGGLAVGGGVAAAATGSLPDPVQQTARDVLGRLNIDVPGPGGQPDERPTRDATGGDSATTEPARHGDDVSDTVRTTTETGADKGEVVSDVASDGRSRADEDQDNQPPAPPDRPTPDTSANEVGTDLPSQEPGPDDG